jgi:hypothetical protein
MGSGDEDGLFASLPEQSAPEPVGGGFPRLRLAERDQIAWRPVSLDGLLADDHRVRLVWRFVEGLDLTALHATIKAVDGRPGYHCFGSFFVSIGAVCVLPFRYEIRIQLICLEKCP